MAGLSAQSAGVRTNSSASAAKSDLGSMLHQITVASAQNPAGRSQSQGIRPASKCRCTNLPEGSKWMTAVSGKAP